MLLELRVERRFHALEESSGQFAAELAESLRVSEQNFSMMEKMLEKVEDLTKTASPFGGRKFLGQGENLWAIDGLKARMSMAEHILDEGGSGLL